MKFWTEEKKVLEIDWSEVDDASVVWIPDDDPNTATLCFEGEGFEVYVNGITESNLVLLAEQIATNVKRLQEEALTGHN